MELFEQLEFDKIEPKWLLGYSDISALMLAITLKTGLATVHGINGLELRNDFIEHMIADLEAVFQGNNGAAFLQSSSQLFQKEWDFSKDYFVLTEPTKWQAIKMTNSNSLKGRLLGGCVDVIRHLVGTPYGDVNKFWETYIHNEPILWYFENCELLPTDLKRSLLQMKYAGWFENASGILFGRTPVTQTQRGYSVAEVYEELAEELQLPVLYDIDCGHVPPQLLLVNGSRAEVYFKEDHWIVSQHFEE